ncbi:hypothetical protein PHYSODRAFT_339379 [Phytophthora sojae]|uniref:Uncharacterized protein n=1 Tax=Phytophthora sojae (strain P6497) TaxID=1094619 RepID=G5A6M0_PHYSP|nr:hypothetical protein PHYSODRAFT_339379 [Phytophthora sojae]EGZ08975.1 hypothetical protein PHYSODRAFT_339379 [Phytophthora sojae]|eukprot:XP_009535608.1 hypothetical protein PHYSODRAFT_339379 [Phytophthora sojae]
MKYFSGLKSMSTILKKSPKISKKFEALSKKAEVITTLQRNPTLSKINTAAKKDPKILTKIVTNPESMKTLSKQPDVIQLSKTLLKNGIRITRKEGIDIFRAIKANFWDIVAITAGYNQGSSLSFCDSLSSFVSSSTSGSSFSSVSSPCAAARAVGAPTCSRPGTNPRERSLARAATEHATRRALLTTRFDPFLGPLPTATL